MKQQPAQFAVHSVGDRWFAIAPDEWTLQARTFDRRELCAVDADQQPRPAGPPTRPYRRRLSVARQS